MSPPCESYLEADQLDRGEAFYPLHVRICSQCLLVQLRRTSPAKTSSPTTRTSRRTPTPGWRTRSGTSAAVDRLGLAETLRRRGRQQRRLPAAARARAASGPRHRAGGERRRGAGGQGHRHGREFLGQATGTAVAAEHGKADLVSANNVFAHVPDIVDFAQGLRALVKDDGTVTIEIPHLLRLIEDRHYDTIYHEHYSYLSLLTTSGCSPRPASQSSTWKSSRPTAGRCGLGRRPAGTRRAERASRQGARRRARRRTRHRRGPRGFAEASALPATTSSSSSLGARPRGQDGGGVRRPRQGQHAAQPCRGPRGPARYTVDRSTFKQGMFLPGTHIPIHAPEKLAETSRTTSSSSRGTSARRSRHQSSTPGSGARSSSSAPEARAQLTCDTARPPPLPPSPPLPPPPDAHVGVRAVGAADQLGLTCPRDRAARAAC